MIKACRQKIRPRPTECEALAELMAEAALYGISFGKLIRNYRMGFYKSIQAVLPSVDFSIILKRDIQIKEVTQSLFSVNFGTLGDDDVFD